MDKVLVPYLTADDEREREQHLDELLTHHAAPLIRQCFGENLAFMSAAKVSTKTIKTPRIFTKKQ